ncbi:MAG: hypothetical protein ACTSVZ_06685 [Promethearchaeota archaeon]
MSKWPQICVRCGESNQDLLSQQNFSWKYLIMQTQNQGYTKNQWAVVDVNAYICQNCNRIGRIRWTSTFVMSLLGTLLGFPLVFGAFGEIIIEGLMLLLPSLGILIFTVLMRRQVSRYYAHFYYATGWVRGFFRSPDYKKAFDESFPDEIYLEK